MRKSDYLVAFPIHNIQIYSQTSIYNTFFDGWVSYFILPCQQAFLNRSRLKTSTAIEINMLINLLITSGQLKKIAQNIA